jgi:LCP family protein required for cell wall assembly
MLDERTPEQLQEDWVGRLQPMRPVWEDELSADTVQHITVAVPVEEPLASVPLPLDVPQHPPQQQQRGHVRRRHAGRRPLWKRFAIGLAAVVGLMTAVTLVLPPLDLLVLGVDARPGEGYVTRTDSIMMLSVQPRRARLNLLSLPRDLFINVPGYNASQRINTINLLGEMDELGSGPDLLADSIEGSFGIGPDRYVRMNFNAFVQMVDAVGGLRINVPKAIVDYQYPTENYGTMTVRFEPGWQRMNGETALIYARTRHADDDYGRAERQQQVVTALARKLANPLNWIPAGVAVSRNVDTNMNPIEMGLYAPAVMVGSLNMNRLVVNRDYILPGAQGAVPDYEKLGPWLDGRFD